MLFLRTLYIYVALVRQFYFGVESYQMTLIKLLYKDSILCRATSILAVLKDTT